MTRIKKALVIIDVQPLFLAHRARRIHNPIRREIETAIQRRDRIFVVTYYGRSCCRFLDKALRGYDKRINVSKNRDSAGDKLHHEVERKRTHFVLTGVNTDACVLGTADGLIYYGHKVTVASDACWSTWENPDNVGDVVNLENHEWGLEKLKSSKAKVV